MGTSEEIIILRRPNEEAEPKKGGVWKIAHADFMTAMMAFFLIMWLVNATDEEIKKSIANYFNPMDLTQAPSDRRGLHEPDEVIDPLALHAEAGKQNGSRQTGADVPGDGGSMGGGGNVEEGNENRMDSAGIREETDGAAFHDPYAVLASSAADLSPEEPVAVDVPQSTIGTTGQTVNTEDARDPFDPAYWQTRSERAAQSLRPGRASADRPAPDDQIDASDRAPTGETPLTTQPMPDGGAEEFEDQDSSEEPAEPQIAEASEGIGPRSPIAEAILAQERQRAAQAPEAGERSAHEIAEATAQELRQALDRVSAEVAVAAGEESVLISLTDDNSFSMFPIGSAEPTREAVGLFARIAGVLGERDGTVVVRGHTDARPFLSGASDNWTLSFERAHATKRALVQNGVEETRIARVEGLADREPTVPADPLADANRRIEILYQPVGEAP